MPRHFTGSLVRSGDMRRLQEAKKAVEETGLYRRGAKAAKKIEETGLYKALLAERPRLSACHGCFTPWDTLSMYFDDEITLDYVMDNCVIHGSVNKVVDQILALREEIGDFGELVYAGMDWAEPALNKRSMQLMAEQVMPKVNAVLKE